MHVERVTVGLFVCEGFWVVILNLNLFWVLLHVTRVLKVSNRCARASLLFL